MERLRWRNFRSLPPGKFSIAHFVQFTFLVLHKLAQRQNEVSKEATDILALWVEYMAHVCTCSSWSCHAEVDWFLILWMTWRQMQTRTQLHARARAAALAPSRKFMWRPLLKFDLLTVSSKVKETVGRGWQQQHVYIVFLQEAFKT